VLLVDDDPVVRDIIKSALEREYDVVEASGYSEVIDLLNYPVDVAIIDYILPDCDGFDILKKVREVHPALPAIIMTGFSHERVVIKAIRSEVADYIKKPLKLAYLKKRLAELFGNESEYGVSEDIENREEFILDGVAEHIEDNYAKNLTLDKLSAMSSYLNSIRVKNAAELLINPNISIGEVARVVGYSSVTHFERVFKAVFGMTPREYRKRERKILTQE